MTKTLFASALWLRTAALLILALCAGTAPAGTPQKQFDLLLTTSGAFSNVTVTARTDTHINIQHQVGMQYGFASLKIADLDSNTQARINGTYVPPEAQTNVVSTNVPLRILMKTNKEAALKEMQGKIPFKELAEAGPLVILGVAFGIVLLFHLFFSWCSKLICQKAGHPPGLLIWLPILQIFPMFKAAGMSAWWVLGMFIPLVNLIVSIVWCFKITAARGKSILVAILLLIPGLSLLAFLYLAFSSGEGE